MFQVMEMITAWYHPVRIVLRIYDKLACNQALSIALTFFKILIIRY